MAAKEGYCVKCKAKKDIKDPVDITMKNGRPATQGTCPDCGTKIFKIGKSYASSFAQAIEAPPGDIRAAFRVAGVRRTGIHSLGARL